MDGIATPDPDSFYEDQAILGVPKGTVNVEIAGTVRVVIRTGMKYPDGRAVNLPVVDFINDGIPFVRDTIIPKPAPFIVDKRLKKAAGA